GLWSLDAKPALNSSPGKEEGSNGERTLDASRVLSRHGSAGAYYSLPSGFFGRNETIEIPRKGTGERPGRLLATGGAERSDGDRLDGASARRNLSWCPEIPFVRCTYP